MTNPTLTIIDDKQDPFADDEDHYIPVYSGTAELPSSRINRAVLGCLDHVIDSVVDFLPDDLRRERDLPPRRTAILRYHKPTSPEDVDVARRRLAYEELLFSQLAVRLARQMQRTGPKAHPVEVTDEIERRIRARLPFALTAGQDQAVSQILADMSKQVPMNRMLQADVGAGKTAVAVFAALAAIANRHQVALLAPTEVLARQHSDKIQQYLTGSRVGTGFLAGSTSRSDRREMLDDLAHGRIDWAIGTHALLEDDVAFSNLGLVIIDEQHKFGVAQRARLRSKGFAPHNLVLSATPIPRTLAMTVFGDLDVSIIEGTLPNRQPIDTRLVTPEQSTQAWEFVRKRLGKGEQAYVVYPLVEESETIQRKAATVEAGRLAHHELSGFRIGLLHGRMNPAEKHQVMQQFHAGDVNVLVSTTVIEVGVDVPNATMMIIQHSNAYGLSQLHQLRGRVGRGSRRSFCLLFCDTQEQSSTSPASQRFNILCETNDGFRIAEEDLRIRGPGELLGKRQHGIPEFRVANLVEDLDLLQLARDDAQRLLAADVHLADPEHKLLKSALMHRYSRSLNLIDVA